MNLKRARYIIAIYEEGGMTAAAKKLFVSQPSLSQTVRLVERELGVEIFRHGITPPRLTYAGEQYIAAARAMMVQENNLNNILAGIRHEDRGRLRVGVSMQRGMQFLPNILPEFTEQYPDVRLLLVEKGSADLEKMVVNGDVDFAMLTTESSNPNLEYQLIESESFGLLAGSGSRMAKLYAPGQEIVLSAAAGETFISLKPGHNIRLIQDKLFAKYGLAPKIFLETDSVEAAVRITASCGFCMLCPHVFARNNPALAGRSTYFPIEGQDDARHFYVCYQKRKFQPKYERVFIRLVQEDNWKSQSRELPGAAGT